MQNFDHPARGWAGVSPSFRPYGQPGQLPNGGTPPLLIELKAQFYELVTLQPVRFAAHINL